MDASPSVFLLLILLFLWGRMANFASEMLKKRLFHKKTLSFIIHFAKKGEYVGRRQ